MGLKASEWSVVIVGRWNRAILTPSGIARRIFKLAEPGQMSVAVPLDGVSPYVVKNPNQMIACMTDEGRLIIQLERFDYETLEHAMAAGVSALQDLPQTPVSAAGFNVYFHSEEVTPQLATLLTAEAEKPVVEAGYPILARTIGRTVQFGDGRLNLMLAAEEGGFKLSFNFHRDSDKVEDLTKWLQTPVEEVRKTVEELLTAFGLDLEEELNDANPE